MARLTSEDEQIKSGVELLLLKEKQYIKDAETWIPYNLSIESGSKNIVYRKENDNYANGDFVFSLTPVNEIQKLIDGISCFLDQEKSNNYFFEPFEPSFEIMIEKSFKGYSVVCWVDAGNVISDHCTWDGIGVRFFTTKEKIQVFINELRDEMQGVFKEENVKAI